MKTLKESLFSKKNLDYSNKYGITKKDMIGSIKGFPVGVVVRMMEEQEAQGNKPNVHVFQKDRVAGRVHVFQKDRVAGRYESGGGFNWGYTEAKFTFWNKVITFKDFDVFFAKYPEYKEYN